MSVKNWWPFSQNLRVFEPDTEPSSTRLDSDTEEEEEEVDVEEVNMEDVDAQGEAIV